MVSDCGEILSRNPTFLALLKRADVVTLSVAWSEPGRDPIAHAASGTIAVHLGPDMKSAEYIGLRETNKAGHARWLAMQQS
jgi:hypothetical protein